MKKHTHRNLRLCGLRTQSIAIHLVALELCTRHQGDRSKLEVDDIRHTPLGVCSQFKLLNTIRFNINYYLIIRRNFLILRGRLFLSPLPQDLCSIDLML
jgi:hypothetical protein